MRQHTASSHTLRLLSILAVALGVGLVGCGNQADQGSNAEQAGTQQTAQPTSLYFVSLEGRTDSDRVADRIDARIEQESWQEPPGPGFYAYLTADQVEQAQQIDGVIELTRVSEDELPNPDSREEQTEDTSSPPADIGTFYVRFTSGIDPVAVAEDYGLDDIQTADNNLIVPLTQEEHDQVRGDDRVVSLSRRAGGDSQPQQEPTGVTEEGEVQSPDTVGTFFVRVHPEARPETLVEEYGLAPDTVAGNFFISPLTTWLHDKLQVDDRVVSLSQQIENEETGGGIQPRGVSVDDTTGR